MAPPEKHELETAGFFANMGKDVEFLPPSRTKGSKTPDIKMDGVLWEIKSPVGKSKNTIFNALRRGVKQSANVIIDLRLAKVSDERAVKDLELSISRVKSVKRVMLITKAAKITILK
jgi:contact-dependent growth inhibition (CDI) system CdiA-like toxin